MTTHLNNKKITFGHFFIVFVIVINLFYILLAENTKPLTNCPNAVYYKTEIIAGIKNENEAVEAAAERCIYVCGWLNYAKPELCDNVQKNCNECVDNLTL